jgi:site-specific DNA-methyltransferase (adenine-specific)
MSIDDAASELGVSTATIRNWIKTKYLRVDAAGFVLSASIKEFEGNVAGVEKLTKRANKSKADFHDHASLQASITAALASQQDDPETLADQYESSLSDSYRNQEGIYYTPHEIAIPFFSHLPKDVSKLTFCDPCCGTGNYLLAAIEHGFSPENVYGVDTDPTALQIARSRIAARTGYDSQNLKQADFLELVCNGLRQDSLRHFDVIFTNPPWGKKLTKTDKTNRATLLNAGRCLDTSALFFFAALNCLRPGGYLGLLLPEAFFNIATFQDAREKALQNQIIALYDFGRPFKTLLTKAKGLVLKFAPSTNNESIACVTPTLTHQVHQRYFKHNPKSIINLSMSEREAETLEHVFRFPHITLADNARWGLGIVTGNNARFVSQIPKPGYVPVYRGADVFTDHMAEPTAFIPDNFSQYQQVAPLELYRASGKLIYRFISSDLVFYYDVNQKYILNSANMLVLNSDFPFSGAILARYLSSSIINWIFKTLFQTHKILRSDLEQLPLFTEFLSASKQFSEVALLKYLELESDNNGSFRVKKKDLR